MRSAADSAGWARAYAARWSQLVERTHASWWGALDAPCMASAVCSWHVDWLQLPMIQADAEAALGNAVALLPRSQMRRLLAARALVWRRRAVWTTTSTHGRQRLQTLLGMPTYLALLQEARSLGTRMSTEVELPGDETLACEGLYWLQQDGLLTDPSCVRLMTLEFDVACRPFPGQALADTEGGKWWLDRVPTMLPEMPGWWFGSGTTSS